MASPEHLITRYFVVVFYFYFFKIKVGMYLYGCWPAGFICGSGSVELYLGGDFAHLLFPFWLCGYQHRLIETFVTYYWI